MALRKLVEEARARSGGRGRTAARSARCRLCVIMAEAAAMRRVSRRRPARCSPVEASALKTIVAAWPGDIGRPCRSSSPPRPSSRTRRPLIEVQRREVWELDAAPIGGSLKHRRDGAAADLADAKPHDLYHCCPCRDRRVLCCLERGLKLGRSAHVASAGARLSRQLCHPARPMSKPRGRPQPSPPMAASTSRPRWSGWRWSRASGRTVSTCPARGHVHRRSRRDSVRASRH